MYPYAIFLPYRKNLYKDIPLHTFSEILIVCRFPELFTAYSWNTP